MVDLTRPPYNTRWLSLLEDCEAGGLQFKDQVLYEPCHLGFSHQANRFGLKGPDNSSGDTVICGTSFATGVGVDQGLNWYELCELDRDYFNIGFPVSNYDHRQRLDRLYQGSYGRLIYIYHPNIWYTGIMFQKARQTGVGIFRSMGWDRLMDLKLKLPRFFLRSSLKRLAGRTRSVRVNGKRFSLNTGYCLIDPVKYRSHLKQEMSEIKKLTNRFDSVLLVRVPIKEEVFARHSLLSSEQCEQISRMWQEFTGHLEHKHILDLSNDFAPSHYHQFDNHWNAAGNMHFSELISRHID